MAYINQQLQNECYEKAEEMIKIYTDDNNTPPFTVVEMAAQLYQTIIEKNQKKEND